MLVKDWMSTNVVVAKPDMSMMKAAKLMKDNTVSRLPVVDDSGLLLGIVSDRDVKGASPSKATSLDMHELYYLLSEIKVRDIMTKNPYFVRVGETVEKAAVVMLEHHIGGLPVVDEDSRVVGILTDADVFKVLVNITGVLQGGVQMGLELADDPGGLKPVFDDLREAQARIMSVLTSYGSPDKSLRNVYIRIQDMDKSRENALHETLAKKYKLLFWVRDNLHPLVP